MILVNQQLKKDGLPKTHREMFPRLYYQNFSGDWERISNISVKIINEDIDVQTDLNDIELVSEYVTKWLENKKAIAERNLQEAKNTLKIINSVL